MEIFRFSFGAVGPIILLIGLGLFLRRIGLIGESDLNPLTRLVFRVFLPVMNFNNVLSIDFSAEVDAGLILFSLLAVLGVIVGSWLLLLPLIRDRELHGAVVHVVFRSNFVILGMALMSNLYGAEGVRLTAMITPTTIIPYNLFAVLVLSAAKLDRKQSPKQIAKTIFQDIATNPLILSCVLGVLVGVSGVRFPGVVDSALGSVGAVATPLSIMLLGAQLDFRSLHSNLPALLAATAGRLVVVPAIMTTVAALCGYRNMELAVLFVLFASPCATSVGIMTRIYDVKPVFSAQVAVLTNALCCLTLFIGLSILRGLALL